VRVRRAGTVRMRRGRLALALLGLALAAAAAPAQAAYVRVGTLGGPGVGPGRFGPPRAFFRMFRLDTSPSGVAFDDQGNVYVADTLGDQIERFSPGGRVLGPIGRPGFLRAGQIHHPAGLAVAGGRVYVSDNGNDRVDVLTTSGHSVGMFYARTARRAGTTRGGGPGQLSNPFGIALGADGLFYVADLDNSRVNRYDAAGTPRGSLGTFGRAPGRFLGPFGVAADPSGAVWVSDREANRLQKLSPSGAVLATVGGTGTGPGEFISPEGIATDRVGDVYVADLYNRRVQKLAPDGRFLTSFGQGQLRQPTWVAVDSACRVYVSDYRRVVVFADPGAAC
jgi:tripartite motif-containing protein 71